MYLFYFIKTIIIMFIFLLMMKMNLFIFCNYNLMLNLSDFFFSDISLIFFFDKFSIVFLFTVFLVVLNVFNFMIIYMSKDKNFLIFLIFTVMFILSMILLIFSFNLLTMIFGWEGLGFSSFYLIFFYNNYESWKSGMKTFINNKMGDSMILMCMLYILLYSEINFLYFFMIFSLFTKSAQFPFMSWLPMAMSAPTPISAMVHSSTLVTAGLYIFFRLFNLFLSFLNLNFFLILSIISMFFSSLKASLEKDLKKMIALSTLSQISLIMYMLLLNFKYISFFYMCNHAFFKSLLFMNMGYNMMSNFSNQYMFNLNFYKLSFLNNLSFKISCMNLMNFPFFSSFFLKELFINNMNFNYLTLLNFFFFFFSSFFTMNYSLKFIMYKFNFNFNMKLNFNLSFKNLFNFFFFSFFSLIFSKIFLILNLMETQLNLLVMFIYLIILMLNFYILKFSFSFLNLMMYLNFIIYVFPFNLFTLNKDYMELWMEKISMNYYKILKMNNLKFMSLKMMIILVMITFFLNSKFKL